MSLYYIRGSDAAANTFSKGEMLPARQDLRFGNAYIGLDTAVLQDPVPLPPITNFPLYIGQVNSSDPSAVYLDLHRWESGFGMIYPEDRKFLVSSAVSTIVQFRTLDFGMERCTLVLSAPTSEDLRTMGGDKMVAISPDPFSLDIWTAEASRGIDPRALSWDSKPTRRTLVVHEQLSSVHAVNLESDEFYCPSGSWQTFEIACGSPDCFIEFQQDMKPPRLAFYMIQRQSFTPEIL